MTLADYARPGDSPAIQEALRSARFGPAAVADRDPARPELGPVLRELAAQQAKLDRLTREMELQADVDASEFRRLSAAEMVVSGGGRKALFDLYGITETSFKIRGTSQYGSAAWIAGVKKSIGVSGVTWDTDHWDSGTVSAAVWVYVSMERAGATATLTAAASLPSGSDTTRISPLWYVPWDTDHIDRAGIVDMRHAMQIEAMA